MDEFTEQVTDSVDHSIKWRSIITRWRYKQIAIELAQYDIPEHVIVRVLQSAYKAASQDAYNE
jgi:hypothetical protein